ncbi:MAG: hypothetical protein NDI82_07860 [Anaeromyxobacteraceae bacterium]|nr:hypothetical protein [Anaeromyxobacteraceae bacterium]
MNPSGILLVASLILTAGGPGADEHLLAGAHAFREARYAEALVEFRVAQELGAPESGDYAGATLVKLERPLEAIEAFGGLGGPGRDALTDYYRAVAAYDARLYLAADRLLAIVGDRSGPKIAEQAARLRGRIGEVLAGPPASAAIDWYLAQCAEQRGLKRPILSRAYCQEAAEQALRRPDHYRLSEARAGAVGTLP